MDKQVLRESIERETNFSFSRSGGPGGQNVNKVNTKVTALLDLNRLEGLTEGERLRLGEQLSGRINNRGELHIQVEEERSQGKNRLIALERLENLITSAAVIPKKRRPTRPGKAAREKRLTAKRRQKEKKALRRSSSWED
ncbi:MAG: alternative ribosome rescue aminoacyl-tRNA hydrolase ArfB [Spirochaetales bacterium]|nr:alternative ribosome rescue aminoacyl-tRNA hydrolase ArfB [Spirochaetales bacterium]